MLGAMAAVSLRERLALYLDLIRWDRPAGWLVLYWPTMGALWLAAGLWAGTMGVWGLRLGRWYGCLRADGRPG